MKLLYTKFFRRHCDQGEKKRNGEEKDGGREKYN